MVNPGLLAVRVNLAHRGSCSETGTLDNSGLETPLVVLLSHSSFQVSGLSLCSTHIPDLRFRGTHLYM